MKTRTTLTTFALLALLPLTARAAVQLAPDHVPLSYSASPQSGYLDIYFSSAGAADALAAYTVTVELSGPAGARFVSPFVVSPSTGGSSRASIFPSTPPTALSGSNATTIRGNALLSSGETAISPGDALFSIPFEVDAGVSETWDVTILPDVLSTSLSDGTGNELQISSLSAGSISIVPEPASLAAFGLTCATFLRRRRR